VTFLQKSLPFAELLAHDLDDVVGVAVGLGEDQGLGQFLCGSGKISAAPAVAEVRGRRCGSGRGCTIAVQLVGGVGGVVLVQLFPALLAREAVAWSTCS
jgi:hypothetical protein